MSGNTKIFCNCFKCKTPIHHGEKHVTLTKGIEVFEEDKLGCGAIDVETADAVATFCCSCADVLDFANVSIPYFNQDIPSYQN